jgi:hypothetical protein
MGASQRAQLLHLARGGRSIAPTYPPDGSHPGTGGASLRRRPARPRYTIPAATHALDTPTPAPAATTRTTGRRTNLARPSLPRPLSNPRRHHTLPPSPGLSAPALGEAGVVLSSSALTRHAPRPPPPPPPLPLAGLARRHAARVALLRRQVPPGAGHAAPAHRAGRGLRLRQPGRAGDDAGHGCAPAPIWGLPGCSQAAPRAAARLLPLAPTCKPARRVPLARPSPPTPLRQRRAPPACPAQRPTLRPAPPCPQASPPRASSLRTPASAPATSALRVRTASA